MEENTGKFDKAQIADKEEKTRRRISQHRVRRNEVAEKEQKKETQKSCSNKKKQARDCKSTYTTPCYASPGIKLNLHETKNEARKRQRKEKPPAKTLFF